MVTEDPSGHVYVFVAVCDDKRAIRRDPEGRRIVTSEVNAAMKKTLKQWDADHAGKSIGIKTTIEWFIDFKELVEQNAPWDIKVPERWESTIGTQSPAQDEIVIYMGCPCTTMEIGNYTYAVLGRELGFPLTILLYGSYYAAGRPQRGTAEMEEELKDQARIRAAYENLAIYFWD